MVMPRVLQTGDAWCGAFTLTQTAPLLSYPGWCPTWGCHHCFCLILKCWVLGFALSLHLENQEEKSKEKEKDPHGDAQ